MWSSTVGKQSWSWAKPLLAEKGVYMSTELGRGGQNPLLALVTPLFGGRRVLFPIPKATAADMKYLAELAADGRFEPLIDRVVGFQAIPDMHRYAESGQKTGSIIVAMIGP
jgi:NADPH:quinone reductase-like Zn-dependent oxidoreductase